MQPHTYRKFKLSDTFVENFKNKQPNWGPLGYVTYKRTYSRVMDNGHSEEFWNTLQRVVEGIFNIQKKHCFSMGLEWNNAKSQKTAQEMYTAMWDFKFLPPGRGLWMAGTEYVENRTAMSMFNCFSYDTKILTKEGIKQIGSLAGTEVEVLTKHGSWVSSPITNFGEQELCTINLRRGRTLKTIRATPGHNWFVYDKNQRTTITVKTSELKTGDRLPSIYGQTMTGKVAVPQAIQHGIVFGDGRAPSSGVSAHIMLCGDKVNDLKKWFPLHNILPYEDMERVSHLPRYFKKVPDFSESKSYLYGWLMGYFAADGTCSKVGQSSISSTTKSNIEDVQSICSLIGIGTGNLLEQERISNLTNKPSTIYEISLLKETLSEDFFLLDKHKANFNKIPVKSREQRTPWKVISVDYTGEKEEVYCATVEGYGHFVLHGNILTGNCCFVSTEDIDRKGARPFAFMMDGLMLGVGVGFDTKGENKIKIQTPEVTDNIYLIDDSREGWVESVEILIDSYFTGSKLPEFDYSSLREEGKPLKGFGGTSSGPQPLINLHNDLVGLFSNIVGEYISSTNIVDIENYISKCVIAGNVRRSAALALGKYDDKEFIELKHDKEKLMSHRYGSNNSILAIAGMDYTEVAKHSAKQGEPGYIWLENARNFGRFKDGKKDRIDTVSGFNPCHPGYCLIKTSKGDLPLNKVCGKENLMLVNKYGDYVPGKVWESGIKETIMLFSGDVEITTCTPNHIYLTEDLKEVQAKDLVGITLSNGIKITKKEGTFKHKVYDFSVSSDDHFGVIDGCVVHNCAEQQLESMEVCCLVETFPANHDTLEEYLETLKLAYLYGKSVTLVNTHWPETNGIMLKNRRIGLSQTGIQQARHKLGTTELLRWCDDGYNYIQELDIKYSDWLCVPRSKRTTSIKPSGTVSILPGATPGIHYPESEFYIRRIMFQKESKLLPILKEAGYDIEKSSYSSNSFVVSFPVKEENFSRTKTEVSLWEQMEFAAKYQHYWADNAVSITVTFKEEEAKDLKYALELYEDRLKVVSFLPLSTHGYEQAPYEAITEEEYNKMVLSVKEPDFSTVQDNEAIGEKFCDGDSCQV